MIKARVVFPTSFVEVVVSCKEFPELHRLLLATAEAVYVRGDDRSECQWS